MANDNNIFNDSDGREKLDQYARSFDSLPRTGARVSRVPL
ncbi:hypothetical protein FHW89_003908 [Mucilaginibacter sp. SG564]|nr:hypothetical protein [Mucilaginibacter sp. SG564]